MGNTNTSNSNLTRSKSTSYIKPSANISPQQNDLTLNNINSNNLRMPSRSLSLSKINHSVSPSSIISQHNIIKQLDDLQLKNKLLKQQILEKDQIINQLQLSLSKCHCQSPTNSNLNQPVPPQNLCIHSHPFCPSKYINPSTSK